MFQLPFLDQILDYGGRFCYLLLLIDEIKALILLFISYSFFDLIYARCVRK